MSEHAAFIDSLVLSTLRDKVRSLQKTMRDHIEIIVLSQSIDCVSAAADHLSAAFEAMNLTASEINSLSQGIQS